MSPNSPAADALAHRLLAAASAAAVGGDPVTVATRVLADIADTLARWFGPYGYHALLTRAVARAQPAHPVLATVRVHDLLTPVLDGLPEAATAHGVPAVHAAVAAVIAGVVDLLGRVIGDDMARNLLESLMLTAPPPDATRPGALPHAAHRDVALPHGATASTLPAAVRGPAGRAGGEAV